MANILEINKREGEYWSKFEKGAKKYGIPFWVDYQNANTKEIPFINYSTDPEIDRLLLGKQKDYVISKASRGRVFDVGCGAGWLCLEIARRGGEVEGMDVGKDRIKTARDYAKSEKIKIKYTQEDVGKCLWGKKNYYDAIVNWNSLHHVSDPDKVLAHVKQCLKKDGLFVSWDHLGDNKLVLGVTNIASRIPGFYSNKVKVLGTVHSAAEGIADKRLTPEVMKKNFIIKKYERYFFFIHLIPPIYKYLKFRKHIPIPKFLLIVSVKLLSPLDAFLLKIFPSMASYCLIVAKPKK